MLLNISNHPSAHWPEAQRQAALERFDEVQDLPHPQVDPQAGADDIMMLARSYLADILNFRPPLSVHLMGEQSFCYALTRLLQQHGIAVFCSTTRRITEPLDDGSVKRSFAFVQFREYPLLHST